MVLRNEPLFMDDEEILYKTIDVKEQLYGIHSSKRGEIIAPSFLHIWEFDDDGTTVVIDQQEQYWEIDFNGIVVPLDPKKEEEYKSYIIKNSRCNCWNQENFKDLCNLCDGMQEIENAFSERSFNKFFGLED